MTRTIREGSIRNQVPPTPGPPSFRREAPRPHAPAPHPLDRSTRGAAHTGRHTGLRPAPAATGRPVAAERSLAASATGRRSLVIGGRLQYRRPVTADQRPGGTHWISESLWCYRRTQGRWNHRAAQQGNQPTAGAGSGAAPRFGNSCHGQHGKNQQAKKKAD